MSARLLTAEEVAEQLGIELDTLYRYARAGQIRAVKLGKLWRFAESDVAAFIEARRFTTRRPPAPDQKRMPDDVSPAFDGQHDGERPTTSPARTPRADIDAIASRLAVLLADVGVRAGDRVLVTLPTGAEFAAACLAGSKIGTLLASERVDTQPAELARVIGELRPAALVTNRAIAQRLEDRIPGLDTIRLVLVEDAAVDRPVTRSAGLLGLGGVGEHAVLDGLPYARVGTPGEVARAPVIDARPGE